MDKTADKQINELKGHKESSKCPQNTQLPPWAMDSDPFVSFSDTVKGKTDMKPKAPAPELQVKVPDITKRVRSDSVPRTFRTLKVTATITPSPSPMLDRRKNNPGDEAVKVLSTAGTGIKRGQEVNEALGNVNSDNGKNFQEISVNRITNLPRPFCNELSETSTQQHCFCNQNADTLIQQLNQTQKTQLSLDLFNDLPSNLMEEMIAQKLCSMSSGQLGSVFSRLPEEVNIVYPYDIFYDLPHFQTVSNVVPILFTRTSDDVKLSLILESLPKLSVQKILKDLNNSEKEVIICLKRISKNIYTCSCFR